MSSPAPILAHDLTPDVAYALETLVRVVERQSGEFRASILLLSDDGRHMVDAAGPSLPEAYRRAIHGLEIGPQHGSCGTAAFTGRRVVVADIAHDPLWERYRDIALPHGLVACWSQPVFSEAGQVIGTFAMYYGEVREPDLDDLHIITAAAARAGAMLDKARQGARRTELVHGIG
jgi:GAF domain-containing protein